MIYFDDLPLSPEILAALAELKIDYVFQPIFYPDGKTVYAREALMRPQEMPVMELIWKYQKEGKLHVLEVATFFGATQAFLLRGYDEILAVNSFPNEIFTKEEVEAFIEYFGRDQEAMIIEMLEYPEFSPEIARVKRKFADISKNMISIDDFGAGINNFKVVEATSPNFVKIDRSLLTHIDTEPDKQDNCRAIIEIFHRKGRKVVAEGIETKGEFECMKALGADFFQGYYLGMPE